MSDSFTFKPLDKTTLKEQVTLFNKVFEKKWSVEEWEYINYGNPLSARGNLVGVFDDDKLIGINSFMAMRYQYQGKTYNALQSCNSAVDPNYQGKGLFKRLLTFAVDYYKDSGYDFIMGTPNPNSHPAFQKMGWTDMVDLRYLILQLNSNTLINRILKLHPPRCFNVFSGYLNLKRKLFAKENPRQILERHTKLTPELSGFVSSLSNESFVMDNDYETLKWKLMDPSYIYYTVKENNQVVAFFVVREHPYISITGKTAELIESCYVSDELKVLKSAHGLFITELRKNFDIIFSWKALNSKMEKKILKASGYYDFHIRTPYIVKILTTDSERQKLIQQKNLWNPQEIEFDTVVKFVEDNS